MNKQEDGVLSNLPPHLYRSVTECRTNPYPSQGYGKSMNWHFYAVKAADKTKEKCNHLDKNSDKFNINNVLITMSPISEGLSNKIKFKVTCGKCDKLFILSSQKLSDKFIKFYGL